MIGTSDALFNNARLIDDATVDSISSWCDCPPLERDLQLLAMEDDPAFDLELDLTLTFRGDNEQSQAMEFCLSVESHCLDFKMIHAM